MPFEVVAGFGLEVCGGTHGIYGDAALTQLVGKLDTTGNGGSETWHWRTLHFPDTFYVKLSAPPAYSARAPSVWDYVDQDLGPLLDVTPSAPNARRWRITRDGDEVGFLLLTDTDALRWFVVPGEVGPNHRIKGLPKDVLLFQRHTALLSAAPYHMCNATRRPDFEPNGPGSAR